MNQEQERLVQKTVLPNGIRVITEEMPHVRSVSAGIWLDAGARHEDEPETGITHFIEHMVFKGTGTRSAEDIACAIDALGGYLDAFTMKETVAFTIKVLDEHLPRALDVVSDMVLNPSFRQEDIVKEKGVVLEELKMDEDNPEYLLHEVFSSNFWKGHPLGRPIIGTRQTITSFEQRQLQNFFRNRFRPERLIITAAGHVTHEQMAREIESRFGGLRGGGPPVGSPPPRSHAGIVVRDKPALEQVHVCLGVETCPMASGLRYAGYVLSTLLGGGVSSRLFLKIREREGLAYSVFSDLNLYSDAGLLSVYAGTSLETAKRVVECVLHEFRDLKENPVPEEELRRAKDHLKGSLMLSLESTSSRMSNLARQEMYFGRFFTLDEVIANIEQVSAGQVQAAATEWFSQERLAGAVLGELNGFHLEPGELRC